MTRPMTRAKGLSAVSAVAAWILLTAATSYNDAARLFDNGDYLEAASMAAKINTASSLALASRAALTHAIYVADQAQRPADVQRGAEFASKALALDPNHVEARLSLVIALHQQARASSPVSAYLRGYASEARSHLDTALRLDPSNSWTYSLLGGWHFETVRLAGPVLAKNLLGASLTDGRAAFSKAIDLSPGSIVLHYNLARALLLNDPVANRSEAVKALETALATMPKNHLDGIMAARARTILDAVNSASPEALQQALGTDGL